jgi:putative NADH-flavin reductase
MKIALIGATGYVGSEILAESLARGHDITAIVRHPEKLAPHKHLTVKKGDVFHPELSSLLFAHDVVISAFNAFGGVSVEEGYQSQILGTYALIDAMKKAGIPRLLMVGGAGSLEVSPKLRLVDTPEFPKQWKEMALSMAEVLNILKQENELDWTFLSPSAMLEPGERTRKFRLGKNTLLRDSDGKSRISTQDYAVAMLDEVEKPVHSRQRFTVGY